MEILIEFLGELLFEGIVELAKDERVPKAIRYPLLALFAVLYGIIIILLIMLAIKAIKVKNMVIGVFFLLCSLLLLILFISFFIKSKNKKTTN